MFPLLASALLLASSVGLKPVRQSHSIWPHLDNGCKPIMLRVSMVDLDAFPVWKGDQIPKAIRHRLSGETRKALEALDLYRIHSSGTGMGDDYDALLIVELDISLANKVFFSSVKYQRTLLDQNIGQRIRATVYDIQTYGAGFDDPDVAVTKTLQYVKKFVSNYLAMNECGN